MRISGALGGTLAAVGFLAACGGGQTQSGATYGAGGGALAGAGLGAIFADDLGLDPITAGLVGGLAGALVGGAVGGGVGAYLDERDARRAAEAQLEAIDQYVAEGGRAGRGRPVQWASQENPGVSGFSQVTAADPGAQCVVTQNVAYINGEERRVEERRCLRDGQWLAA